MTVLALAVAAALSLYACGGSESHSSNSNSAGETNTAPMSSRHQAGNGEIAKGGGQGSQQPRNQPHHAVKPQQTSRQHQKADTEPQGSPTKASGSCPKGVSRKLCRQVEKTGTSTGTSTPSGSHGGCPVGMSRSVCAAAEKVIEESGHTSAPGEPGVCPPALSAAQCEELAEIYGKAGG